jgi:hypothetical protein
MPKKWLLEGRDVSSSDDDVKKIQPCKLPLLCNVDLDSITSSEKSGDVSFVVKTRYMTKTTQKVGEYAKQVVRYAWGRRDAKLTWCTSKTKTPLRPGDIGSFADSSWD